jgi:hypothetical protein
VFAILNAGVREKIFRRKMSELTAHQLSSIVLSIVIIGLSSAWFVLFSVQASNQQLWLIGSMWLSMTIIFEFIFGHYVMNHSWKKLFADYNILEGKLWILVVVTILVSPILTKIIIQ